MSIESNPLYAVMEHCSLEEVMAFLEAREEVRAMDSATEYELDEGPPTIRAPR